MRAASPVEQFLIKRFSVRQVVNALGASAAALCVLGIVVIFGAVSYASITKELEFRANQSAARIAKFVDAAGPLWPFQATRLAELIELPGEEREAFRQTIISEPGTKTVVSEPRELQWPILAAKAPIVSDGKLIGRVQLAVKNDQFELHYQPLFDLGTNRIVGCEALMRWRHRDRGNVSPTDFIPIAEDTGLIKPLGAWPLKTACQVAATWPEEMSVAVNLSVNQFQGQGLLSDIRHALEHSGLAPHRLELEITESIILAQTDAVLGILGEIKVMWVKISMDDIGTGYSSLSYLQKFQFDKIKINRSFVDGIDTKPDCRAIVHAITSMSQSLGMTTTGEGVETEQELQVLREKGCT